MAKKVKIRDERKAPGFTTFGDLELGDAFMYPAGEAVYVKTCHFTLTKTDSRVALCLNDGMLYNCPDTKEVKQVSLDVAIK